jgi:hypothetical protein
VVGSADDGGPFGCSYRICCDADWRVRSVEAKVAGGKSIRRLSTQLAQRAELRMAWIRIPTLDVHLAPQAYTWLPDGRYRFKALDTGFEAVLEVDADGLVLDYPALFRRVGA